MAPKKRSEKPSLVMKSGERFLRVKKSKKKDKKMKTAVKKFVQQALKAAMEASPDGSVSVDHVAGFLNKKMSELAESAELAEVTDGMSNLST